MEYKRNPIDRVNQKGILGAASKFALKKIVKNELSKFDAEMPNLNDLADAKKKAGRYKGIHSVEYKILELAEQRYLELTQSDDNVNTN